MWKCAVFVALLAGCLPSSRPADVIVTDLDAEPREIPGRQVHEDAHGPVIRFASGSADGITFEISAFDTGAMRCIALELAQSASSGCIPLEELPDDDVLTRLAGGGTLERVNPEAGLAPPEVASVWVELGDGRRVDARVVDLRPALDTSVYFFLLGRDADARVLVAASEAGEVLKRIRLDDQRR